MNLVDELRTYQVSIGNSGERVATHLAQLAEPGARCVVGGQQVGFATGPLLTVLKAITCVQEAKKRHAVPVFWAHTEDHDVHEVASATVLGAGGDLHRYKVSLPAGHFVEDLQWCPEHEQILAEFMSTLGVPDVVWQQAVCGARRYAEVMIRLLVQIMDGSGLIFLEPRVLRQFAGEFFARELNEAVRWREILKRDASAVLRIEDDHTNLFYKGDCCRRLKIRETSDGFIVGERHWQLADLVRQPPARFSTGVAARPLLQDTLLPTVAVIAGPNEARYLGTLHSYYQARAVAMPALMPRIRHTFVPDEARGWLEQMELTADEISVSPDKMHMQRERALAVGLPPRRLHYLRNLLHPYGKPQERVLTWWQFSNDRGSYRVMEQEAALS